MCIRDRDQTNREHDISDDQKFEELRLNEFNKEKRDINAQEGMWRAANALVFLTYIQVIVGGATVLLVIFTYKTQRRELHAANRAADVAELASKPYVYPKIHASFAPDHSFVKNGKTFQIPKFNKTVTIQFGVINYGKSPARSGTMTTLLVGENGGNSTSRMDWFDALPASSEFERLRSEDVAATGYYKPFNQSKPDFIAVVEFFDSKGKETKNLVWGYVFFIDKYDAVISDNDFVSLNQSDLRQKIRGVKVRTIPQDDFG